ncbi:MAG: urease accessory protein UreD [Polyangiaceae bacterium]|jgi:urease accessory protein
MTTSEAEKSRAKAFTTSRPGCGVLAFERAGTKTVLRTAFAASPLRILTPRNHGSAAWVFLSTFGGGLVDGDCIDVNVDVGSDAEVLLGTQSSTKVYRSPRGCAQSLDLRARERATVAIVPDPVVCFAAARYRQRIDASLSEGASLVLLDAYVGGRAARGEKWELARFDSRTTIRREGSPPIIEATRLDPAHGSIADRMGRFHAIVSLVAIGPRFARMRDALSLAAEGPLRPDRAIAAASPLGPDGVVLRVAAVHFEAASEVLRPSFAALARVLGDDPFARKW